MDLDDEELKATRRMNGSDKDVGSMEEDIKILKNIIEQDFSNPMGWSGYYDSELKELQQAIKNLIKAYKELEEKNSLLIQQNITYKRNINDLKHNNIPVSLVEEKIEEINKLITEAQKELGSASKEYTIYVYQKDILQELLEKR